MSDKSSIFVRYQIEDSKCGEVYQGIIGNHYSGFFPFGMMSQAACGLKYFLGNAAAVRFIHHAYGNYWDSTYQRFRRMFDIDEVSFGMNVSFDSAEYVAGRFKNGEITKEKLNEEFFWNDTDFGQLLIDIKGSIQNRSAECAVKYAYINNVYQPESILDIDGYYNRYKKRFGEKEQDILKEIMSYMKEHATLMVQEEVDEFLSTPVYDFLFTKEFFEEEKGIEDTEEEVSEDGFI